MDTVKLAVDARGVATITLNRPELHNAFDHETLDLLLATLQTVAEDDDVAIVVLAANGISFSAGHDSDWMRRVAGFSEADLGRHIELQAKLFATLDRLPKPTVARVQGSAFGLGAGLVACCDIALASSEALFCFSEVRLGLCPAIVAPYVVRAIGERAARRYFITGERFNAGKAKRLGLVHYVMEDEDLDATLQHQIDQLLLNGPLAMRAAKALVHTVASQPIAPPLIADTVSIATRVRGSAEGREGIAAFLDKRKPNWSH
jgi:methylglutaconyl-CoA hydratase